MVAEAREEVKNWRKAPTLQIAESVAKVALYCDHAEHNETVSQEWVLDPAKQFRSLSLFLSHTEGISLRDAYVTALAYHERKSPLNPSPLSGASPELKEPVHDAHTWRDLQLVQIHHDRKWHPDVFGMAKANQLRTHTLGLARLLGGFVRWAATENEASKSKHLFPDLLIYGLRLVTVMGHKLGDGVAHEIPVRGWLAKGTE